MPFEFDLLRGVLLNLKGEKALPATTTQLHSRQQIGSVTEIEMFTVQSERCMHNLGT